MCCLERCVYVCDPSVPTSLFLSTYTTVETVQLSLFLLLSLSPVSGATGWTGEIVDLYRRFDPTAASTSDSGHGAPCVVFCCGNSPHWTHGSRIERRPTPHPVGVCHGLQESPLVATGFCRRFRHVRCPPAVLLLLLVERAVLVDDR